MGWTYAKYLLTYERTSEARVGAATASLAFLKEIAQTEKKGGRPLAEDPLFAARIARVEIDLENMKTTNLRVLAGSGSSAAPLELSAMLKIRGTEIRQELASLARIALGPYAQPFVSEALDEGFQGTQIGPDLRRRPRRPLFQRTKTLDLRGFERSAARNHHES